MLKTIKTIQIITPIAFFIAVTSVIIYHALTTGIQLPADLFDYQVK